MATLALAPVVVLTTLAVAHLRAIGPQTRLPHNASALQLAFVALGLFLGVGLALLGPDRLRRAWPPLLAIVIVGLFATPHPSLHVRLLGIALMPTELAKGMLAVTIAAAVASERHDRVIALVSASLVALLLLRAPDHAALAILFSAAMTIALVLERRRLLTIRAGVLSLAVFLATLRGYQWMRLRAWIDGCDPSTTSWLSARAHDAIEGAGITGNHAYPRFAGIFEHNDLGLVDLAARFGLVSVLVVLLFHAGMVLFALHAASRARDRFGAALAIGSSVVFACHGVGNAAMATGLLPLCSLRLGLVSYGGSSVVVLLALLGATAGIAIRGTETKPEWAPRVRVVFVVFVVTLAIVAGRFTWIMLGV